MKYIFNRTIVVSLLTIIFSISAIASDTVLQKKIELLKESYDLDFKNQSGYLSGIYYTKQYPNYTNTPFFQSSSWLPCKLYYGTETFNHNFIKYDLYEDVLVALVFTTEGSKYIQLNKLHINKFELDNKQFEYVDFGEKASKRIYPKYYEVITKGKISLYKSHQKMMKKMSETSYGSFEEFFRYIININTNVYEISTKDDLIQILSKENFAVDEYVEKNNITFKKDFESDLKRVINHFNNN